MVSLCFGDATLTSSVGDGFVQEKDKSPTSGFCCSHRSPFLVPPLLFSMGLLALPLNFFSGLSLLSSFYLFSFPPE